MKHKQYLKTLVDEQTSFVGDDDLWLLEERLEDNLQNVDEVKWLAILSPEIIVVLDDFEVRFQNAEHGNADFLEDLDDPAFVGPLHKARDFFKEVDDE